jgi:C_GCAxxG_C_C family probable redox protein
LSFKEHLGYRDFLIPRLATGFAGGIGRKGSVCGGFIGSIMVIGMKFGRDDPKDRETAGRVYAMCRRFWDRFEQEFGSVQCLSLTGFHLDTPEGIRQYLESGGREKCGTLVRKTARMLSEFIVTEETFLKKE